MKTEILQPRMLFQKLIRYEIPQFQRPYVWTQEDQWEPFWEDVRNTAENYLESNTRQPHFLGAVVLQQRQTAASEIETRIVVDGQQRLTTLQLLLDAVQEVFEQSGYDLPARRMSSLVLNSDEVYWGGNAAYAFKVWPTIYDQEPFRHAMSNDLPTADHGTSLIVQAHEFFKEQVQLWLDQFPDEGDERAKALEEAVSLLLELVVIDLEPADDPHIIFETLNARGTPLLQSDLVKNLILHEASVGIDSDEISHLWDFGDDWWRIDVGSGRQRRPRIDIFLNHWMTTRNRKEIKTNDEFAVFRDYATNNDDSIHDIAKDIGDLGKIYKGLEEGNYPGIATFLYRRQVMQVGVLTPVLLRLFSSGVPEEQIVRGVHALESYLVRRMICQMNARRYSQIFIGLVDKLAKQEVSRADDTIVEYLGTQEAYGNQWPDDQTIEEVFTSAPLYRLLTRGRLRIVLEGIEAELRTNKAESQSVPRNLTIEHIMPQQWRQSWPLPAGTQDKSRAAGYRDRLIHSAGNLTLVTKRLNSALSNAPWEEKQHTLGSHSILFLNKFLLDSAPAVWDENSITERARHLCQAAIKVWPHADGI